jgi:hypothetical protein
VLVMKKHASSRIFCCPIAMLLMAGVCATTANAQVSKPLLELLNAGAAFCGGAGLEHVVRQGTPNITHVASTPLRACFKPLQRGVAQACMIYRGNSDEAALQP